MNYHAQGWDEQIEQDLDTGRLDALLEQVDEEYVDKNRMGALDST